MTMFHGTESMADFRRRVDTGRIRGSRTTYAGVEFRSRLEERFARYLDAQGEHWVYEPQVYGPRGRGYLPDFQMTRADCPTFIEVKPSADEVEAAQRKMSVIWETVPNALLIVACAEGLSFSAALRGQPWTSWTETWTT